MKTKALHKKLTLKKTTISDLLIESMGHARGGLEKVARSGETCPACVKTFTDCRTECPSGGDMFCNGCK